MFDDRHNADLPKARPVIGWAGGKTRMLKHILPLVPEHTFYGEVFGGGLAVFLAKPQSEVEMINDINGELISFYRCCKYHLDALLDELDLVMNSRQEFEDYLAQPGLTEIQRAARWFIRNKLSFGGMGRTFGVVRQHPMSSRVKRLIAIRALNRRFDHTTIEHLTWDRCLDLYDHAQGFFFLDPPYFDAGGSAYAGWSEHELERFCTRVKKLQAAWMVTFQDCEPIRDHLTGYQVTAIERANGIGNNTGRKGRKYREVIITSVRDKFTTVRKGRSA